jgi:hypothetical protein
MSGSLKIGCQRNWIMKFWLRQHNWDSGQPLALRTPVDKCCVMILAGMGRAKSPDHFSRGHLLMCLYLKL